MLPEQKRVEIEETNLGNDSIERGVKKISTRLNRDDCLKKKQKVVDGIQDIHTILAQSHLICRDLVIVYCYYC